MEISRMSKKPHLPKTAPIMIPRKPEESKTPTRHSAPNDSYYYDEGFFVGSPKSGASLKQAKICSDFLASIFHKNGQEDTADEDRDQSSLTGESEDE
jgi:hypothetical protein